MAAVIHFLIWLHCNAKGNVCALHYLCWHYLTMYKDQIVQYANNGMFDVTNY